MPLNSKDYYKILQVDPAAEEEVIKAAFRRLSLKYHPDQNKSSNATAKFQELNEAWEVLGDSDKRAQYDSKRNSLHEAFDDHLKKEENNTTRHHNSYEDLHKKTENTKHQTQEDFTTYNVSKSSTKSSVPIFIIVIFVGLLFFSLMAIIEEKSTSSKLPKQVNRGKVSNQAYLVSRWSAKTNIGSEERYHAMKVSENGRFIKVFNTNRGQPCIQEGFVTITKDKISYYYDKNECNPAYVGQTDTRSLITRTTNEFVEKHASGPTVRWTRLRENKRDLEASEYAHILDEQDKKAIVKFLEKNKHLRIATNADNLDKDCLQINKHPYLFKENLTDQGYKDIVVCFIDSKIKPGKYKDNKGFTRLRGQFMIIVFQRFNSTYRPFLIENGFPLERGYVHTGSKTNFLVQPYCESGPIISYEWRNGKFVKEALD